MRLINLGTIGVLVAAAVTCGGDPYGPTARGNAVTVVNNQFRPASLLLQGGNTVTWTWNSGGVAHSVTFQDGQVSSGPPQTQGTHQRTFGAAGTYRYRCTEHSSADFNSGMIGTVIVP